MSGQSPTSNCEAHLYRLMVKSLDDYSEPEVQDFIFCFNADDSSNIELSQIRNEILFELLANRTEMVMDLLQENSGRFDEAVLLSALSSPLNDKYSSDFLIRQIKAVSKNSELAGRMVEILKSEEDFNINDLEVGKIYFQKRKETNEEFEFIYFGDIEISSDEVLNLLFITTYSGLYEDSKRANSILIIYQNSNIIGSYYLGGKYEHTPFVDDNKLIFKNVNSTCNQITTINFDNGIPEMIFLKCKEENGQTWGDVYSFEAIK